MQSQVLWLEQSSPLIVWIMIYDDDDGEEQSYTLVVGADRIVAVQCEEVATYRLAAAPTRPLMHQTGCGKVRLVDTTFVTLSPA